jgi:uncharacterized membrane protein YhaH (DUF805 family)
MELSALAKRNPLIVLYAGIAVVLASLMGIASRGDYAMGVIGVVVGSVLIVQFYWLQRKRRIPQIDASGNLALREAGSTRDSFNDTARDSMQLFLRTIRGTADFSGRSGRAELIHYWIFCVVVGGGINIAVASLDTHQQFEWFEDVFDSILLLPMFAQFVRRLHDQNRSGWWGLILPLTYLLGVPDMLAEARVDVQAAPTITPLSAASMVLGLVYFVLCLLRGTSGPNDYGPDPHGNV